ncbi:integrase arm-type DNA-binding domain-containing protein [Vibrio barjaei]|uniref:Integrase arm-type DNA-binding domain-containing protein n=1 Tax=Vibrio barjaei TaxID=1676683 RepID=A0ABW7IKT6_9VIBR
MSHLIHRLKDKEIEQAQGRDRIYRLPDGGGLYLLVKPNNLKYWEFRYTKPGTKKRTFLGLGGLDMLNVDGARDKAFEMRKLLKEGIDPKLDRIEKRTQIQQEQACTFKSVADEWVKTKTKIKPKTVQGNIGLGETEMVIENSFCRCMSSR